MVLPILINMVASTGPLHVHVDGEGYFRFARGMQAVYSADANLANINGLICSADGLPLLPQTHLPTGASFSVGMDGTISSAGKAIGRVVLAAFPPNAVQKSGKYLVASTRSQIGFPGDGILGILKSGGGGYSSPTSVSSSPKSDTATIEISLQSEVDKPEILLGDIATFQGSKSLENQIAGIDLGASPMFGSRRGITAVYVLASLRHAGITTDKINLLCPQGAIVVRKSQKIDAQSLTDAAISGVKQQLGDNEDLRSDHLVADVMAPSGGVTVVPIQAVAYGDGYNVNVEVDIDGKMFCRKTISLSPTTPAAKVKQGDPVKVRVTKNGALVQVEGKVRSAARVGSTVTVETEGGASFTGILVSVSTVEVKL